MVNEINEEKHKLVRTINRSPWFMRHCSLNAGGFAICERSRVQLVNRNSGLTRLIMLHGNDGG
jgi:hypothetical protein